jgi:hypothetical protein
MRIIFALLTAALLTGCVTTGSTPTPAQKQTAAGYVAQVQATARRICGFVPLARTVTGLFIAGTGGVFDIAQAICSAVTNNPMTEGPRGGRTVPRVNGVRIEGRFVR